MNFVWSSSKTNLEEMESQSSQSTKKATNLVQEWRFHRWDGIHWTRACQRGHPNMSHYVTVLRNDPLHIKHAVLKGRGKTRPGKNLKIKKSHHLCVAGFYLVVIVGKKEGCAASVRLSLSPWRKTDLVVGICRARPSRMWTTKMKRMNKIRINIVWKMWKSQRTKRTKRNEKIHL